MAGAGERAAGGVSGNDMAAWRALAAQTFGEAALSGHAPEATASVVEAGVLLRALYGAGEAIAPAAIRSGRGAPRLRSPIFAPTPPAALAEIGQEAAGGAAEVALHLVAPGAPGLRARGKAALGRCIAAAHDAGLAIHLRGPAGEAGLPPTDVAKRVDGLGFDPVTWAATGALAIAALGPLLGEAGPLASARLGAGQTGPAFLASGLCVHEAGGGRALELACMAASAVAVLRAGAAGGMAPCEIAPLIACEIAADADVLVTIAALRAARQIWARLGELTGYSAPARIDVRSSARMLCRGDIDTNLLRLSLAALAAGIGGADSITLLAHSHSLGRPDVADRRIARNIWLICAEEAGIGAVADAAGGAFAIEALTDELCGAAWDRFARIEAAGGIGEALAAGALAGWAADDRAALVRDMADGRRVLVGVTAFGEGRGAPPRRIAWRAGRAIAPADARLLAPISLEAAARAEAERPRGTAP